MSLEWTRRWPHDPASWDSLFAAASALHDLPVNQLEAAVDGFLKSLEENKGYMWATPPFTFMVAQVYLDHNIRIERVPELVTNGIHEVEERTERDSEEEGYEEHWRRNDERTQTFVQWMGWPMSLDAWLRLGEQGKAQELLSRMQAALLKEKLAPSATPKEKGAYSMYQATYSEWAGRVAEASGQKLDALAFYRESLALGGAGWGDDRAKNEADLTGRARNLWKQMGGTEEGWQAWLLPKEEEKKAGEVDTMSLWQTQNQALPPFELSDLAGHVWKLSELKGKVVFVSMWATWCGPCRQELPFVQKLYEQLKSRTDVFVLTLNLDSEVGLVEPYVKEHGFSFPVIPAKLYFDGVWPNSGIPHSLVLNRDGVVEREQMGFGNDGEGWLKQASQAIAAAGRSQ